MKKLQKYSKKRFKILVVKYGEVCADNDISLKNRLLKERLEGSLWELHLLNKHFNLFDEDEVFVELGKEAE